MNELMKHADLPDLNFFDNSFSVSASENETSEEEVILKKQTNTNNKKNKHE